ncbi:MAG: Group3 polymerase sigma factor SigF1 [Cyanobacteriota bacterium]
MKPLTRVHPIRDTRARDHLLISHRPLVNPIAHHYAQVSPEPVEDLIQVGLMGLLRAAEGYDPASEVPFDSYARPHIRGAILHHLRDRAWLVRLPRRQAERQWCRQQDGEDLTLLRWRAMTRPLSLEALQREQGSETAEGATVSAAERSLTGGEAEGPYVPMDLAMAWHQCSAEQLLALVGPKQRRVLRHVVLDGWSYRRTASALKVSAPTVQRLLHRALAELQGQLSSDRVPFAAPGC